MKKILKIMLQLFFSIVVVLSAVYFLFGPVGKSGEVVVITVPQNIEHFDVTGALEKESLIRNPWLFKLFVVGKTIEPGGYRLTNSMWMWTIAKKVMGKPDLEWITINGCLRREQIGEMIGKKLGWDQTKLDSWNNAYKNMQPEYIEGVYYPDTYLIPRDETGAQVAQRFINHFNEVFAPYAQKFQDANIRWVTALKVASLIEREAGGASDMPLIAGIIWNRLDKNMLLQIDATLQYTHGKNADGSWWGSIDLSEKKSDSPYNSYLVKGLPPTPICSPGITSIAAVLNPEETDCLFYLHDRSGQIHCAVTYEEHKTNIEKYLK
jgi:UPF0755 protein